MGKEEREIETYLDLKIRSVKGFTRKYTSPGRKGVPDRICFLPSLVIFVEVKTSRGKLSKLQIRELTRIRALKIPMVIVSSKQEVDSLIDHIEDSYEKRFNS